MIIIIGSLKSMSSDAMILASTSVTSDVMRDITSPFFASVKYPMGSDTTLSYNCCRKSRSTPVRMGIMKNDAMYVHRHFSPVITTKNSPSTNSTQPAPLTLICSPNHQYRLFFSASAMTLTSSVHAKGMYAATPALIPNNMCSTGIMAANENNDKMVLSRLKKMLSATLPL